ncbi:P1 family peptidase [Leekyejoonella antrihumi]|uniref:P1 family peptidase n=1 Tax=Leekyejoonella antrihumi TaxID=1660198 RepID=A0A563E6B0_9MICO|nr:P1 family peptidase [Leekyejoonella antrihumi]TWP37965.1 P1 family peptidase [Leekyejoonella antrihumi]
MTTLIGPTNSLTDVAGLRVGHYERADDGWLTGTTCVLTPDGGAVGGVDVRGGGPGTRETDLLDPRNMVERVHAITLTGGSAYGLAAASGVADALGEDGIGLPMGGPGEVVPLVPAAVIFDLGRGGAFANRPDASFGQQAYAAARRSGVGGRPATGCVGAGTGALAGGLKGGVGTASAVLPDGTVVGALVVVNSLGSTVDPRTGLPYAVGCGLSDEFAGLRDPDRRDLEEARRLAAERAKLTGIAYGMATTLAVVGTNVSLTKAQCQKVAGIGHDGMARAIRPVHTMFDGDTVFTLATCERGSLDALGFHQLLDAAGDCVTRAIGHAVLDATTTAAHPYPLRSYRDAFPSAVGA